MPRNISFTPPAFEVYLEWKETDPKIFDKINALILNATRDPFKGLGKPEPLKNEYQGYWSRRITDEHRLIYRVDGDTIKIYKCKGHYD